MSGERKKRAGHRVYVKNILPEVDECLESYDSGTKAELLKWQATLKEQLEKILPLDEVILDQLVADEKASEKDVADKVKQSGRLKADLTFQLASIEEKLAGGQPQLSFPQQHEAAPKKTELNLLSKPGKTFSMKAMLFFVIRSRDRAMHCTICDLLWENIH